MSGKIVSVYGYGRFGKLWAGILAQDFQVKVYSRSGLKTSEVDSGIEITDEQDIFNCDALFFCVAISSFEEVLKKSRCYCKKEAVFFDTCSVKVFPAGWMKKYLPQGSRIIATHPMFGPDSYQQTAKKLPIAICNINADAETLEDWIAYFTSKSLQVEVMTPEKHDEMTAWSQGITHYMGRVLADLDLHPTHIDTLGYKMILEVIEQTCHDSWQLFLDLQNYNPYAKKMRERLSESIGKVNSALEDKGQGKS
jgi:prephenate dehydrogenase